MSNRGQGTSEVGYDAINWRQTTTGVTIYDESNSDAWVHMEFEAGVPPESRLFMICTECGAVFAQRGKPGRGTVCGECGTTYDHDRRD
jgi:hypothetical protein